MMTGTIEETTIPASDVLVGARVYLSGPMTGFPDWNAEAFREAEAFCRAHGAKTVYNPCSVHWSHDPDGMTHEEAMCLSLRRMLAPGHDDIACTRPGHVSRPAFDLVVPLDGWQRSEGARVEVMAAASCGIRHEELADLMFARRMVA